MAANIFKGATNYRAVLDTEIDADSPDSALLRTGIVQAVETLIIHMLGTGVRSTFTADPSNDANGYAYDTVEFDTNDEFNTLTLLILSGTAVGNCYIIDDTVAASNLVACTGDNLYSDGVRSGDDYMILYDIKRTTDAGHDHDGTNSKSAVLANGVITEAKLASSAVAQAKLKTATGSVTGTGNQTLPGGEYGFYPRHSNASAASHDVSLAFQSGNSTVITGVWVQNNAGGVTTVTQRYVTASGPQHFIFFLIDKATGNRVAAWEAPDHPCFGNRGLIHPFVDYDPAKHEITCLCPADEDIAAIYRAQLPVKGGGWNPYDDDSEDILAPTRGFFEALKDVFDIDEVKEGSWPEEPLHIGLPSTYMGEPMDWRFMTPGTIVKPLKSVIVKPDFVTVLSLAEKKIKVK